MPQSSPSPFPSCRLSRFDLEATVAALITDNTLHAVLHAMVELAYGRTKAAHASQHTPEALAWGYLGRMLTRAEAEAAMLQL